MDNESFEKEIAKAEATYRGLAAYRDELVAQRETLAKQSEADHQQDAHLARIYDKQKRVERQIAKLEAQPYREEEDEEEYEIPEPPWPPDETPEPPKPDGSDENAQQGRASLSGASVEILDAIYSSPVQVLRKVEDDGSALVSAVERQDASAARSALFNFVVTAYHVWDWVKVYRPDLAAAPLNPLDIQSIAACRDLANASKHASLTLDKGSYKKHPPVVQDIAVSAIGRTTIGDRATLDTISAIPSQDTQATPWRLKVQLANGPRFSIEVLVAETIQAWKDYFAKHSIK
jgi:hypothetical protein